MLRWIDRLGGAAVGLVRYLLALVGLLYLTLKVVWTDRDLGQRDSLRQVMLQVYFTGVQATGPTVVLGLTVGGLAVLEGLGGLGSISGVDELGRMLSVVVLREVAPLLTGGVVVVRSVTAIAAELGMMRVQREIEALELMGVPPIHHLIAPRVIGGVVSLFALNVVFAASALVSGLLVGAWLASVPAPLFFGSVMSAVGPADVVVFGMKVLLGGAGVFLIACYHGLSVRTAPTEVPVAVSRAALNAFVFLVLTYGAISVGAVLQSNTAGLFRGIL